MEDLKDINVTTFYDNSTASNFSIAIPCGLIAKYEFNDKFYLYKVDKITKERTEVHINQTGIVWFSDLKDKFNNMDMNTVP